MLDISNNFKLEKLNLVLKFLQYFLGNNSQKKLEFRFNSDNSGKRPNISKVVK